MTTRQDDTMPADDRAYLCELGRQMEHVDLCGHTKLVTNIGDEGTPDAFIIDIFNIFGHGGELSHSIARYGTRYTLDDGDGTVLAEGDTVQEVTKHWAWVLDEEVQAAISRARYPDLAALTS